MLRSLDNWIANNVVSAIGIAVILLFFGTMISAKFDSKWGYVVMAVAVIFGLYALRALGVF